MLNTLPENTMQIIQYLKTNGIDPVLYGSQGVSLYLGNFKSFSDVDLLINGEYLGGQWHTLQSIMNLAGYSLVDEHEYEFKNGNNQLVAFASEQVLLRDGVLNSLDEIVEASVGGVIIKTLSPQDFIKAYEFSKKDGYRKTNRGKNDEDIISLLNSYILKE